MKIILFILAAYGVAGNFDHEEEQRKVKTYCSMVAIWKTDAARGVRFEDRAGWPPYDGTEACDDQ